jgi:2,4-dienoyl-CoA reductase-like NADH-dependent reductase (Old Yellow Enzyme family)
MPKLFEHTSIKGMQLKNRLVRSATHEGMADPLGAPTPALAGLYSRLARGGVGLIITGYAFVSPEGRSDAAGMLGIDSDTLIPAYQQLLSQSRNNDVRLALQLVHAGRQTSSRVTGSTPIAPSAVHYRPTGETPRVMGEEDIERVSAAFGAAARRARAAGFDAVQIHAAHGYLLSAFLCPYTNRRTDRWGESIENRMRIVRLVYERCRDEVGDDYPLLIKINGCDTMPGGLKIAESSIMADMLPGMGFDGIEVSCGIGDDGFSAVRGGFPVDVMLDDLKILEGRPVARFFFRHFGRRILRVPAFTPGYNRECIRQIRQRVSVPVFAVGGIDTPADMDDIISRGDADYISLCRPLIIDPDWPDRIRRGSRKPSACLRCNYCLYYSLIAPLRCYRGRRLQKR